MLYEARLALIYKVSKTPVREALHRLIEDGLVVKYARAGYIVTKIGIKDVLDGYHIRVLLETEAAALAARNITEEELRQIGVKTPPSPGEESGSPQPAIPGYNRMFHLVIAQASRNERLARLVRITYDDTNRISLLDPFMSTPYAGQEEHDRIVFALRSRDPEAARRAMKDHIEAGLARALGCLTGATG